MFIPCIGIEQLERPAQSESESRKWNIQQSFQPLLCLVLLCHALPTLMQLSCEVKGTQGLGSDFQSKYFERIDEMMKWSPLSIPATAWRSGKDGVSELAAHATFLLK